MADSHVLWRVSRPGARQLLGAGKWELGSRGGRFLGMEEDVDATHGFAALRDEQLPSALV